VLLFPVIAELEKIYKFEINKFAGVLDAHHSLVSIFEFIIIIVIERIVALSVLVVEILTYSSGFFLCFFLQILLKLSQLILEKSSHVVCTLRALKRYK
jgi:hypothetical protein